MGLAASQSRLLLLTARKSDVEYRGQQINNRRLALTYNLEQAAKNYSNALSNKKLIMTTPSGGEQPLTLNNLVGGGRAITGYALVDSSGIEVKKEADGKYYLGGTGGTVLNDEDMIFKLTSGQFHIENSEKDEKGDYKTVNWRSDGTGTFKEILDDSDDEAAMAEYEYMSSLLQGQDKRLEMELKNLDSSQKAIETEIDAVKKVIDKNIQSSFKTFS